MSSRPPDPGLSRLAEAQRLFKRARYLSLVDLGDAEPVAREAIATARSAMDWLEDTDDFEVAHELLHEIGHFTRTTWPSGCSYTLEDDEYFRDCPADLGHIRAGMSPGMIIRASKCSICGQEPRDCEHINGRIYNGSHCYRIITEADLLEVSLVARPSQPDARITRVSIAVSAVASEQHDQWAPGMPARCSQCLGRCSGFSRPAG